LHAMKVDSRHLLRQLMRELSLIESNDEKEAMAFWILEHEFGLSRTAVLSGKEVMADDSRIQGILQRLNLHEPLLYVLGEAEFYGRRFKVDRSVLIPRPETELLVDRAVEFLQHSQSGTILDIGTGSGCIAITLALELPLSIVHATDISHDALRTARVNSDRLHADVQFHQHDIMKSEPGFGPLDVVVSNPPYILEKEKATMARNVIDFEPGTALFVPDASPLQFHEAIASKAKKVLKVGGLLITEINETLGQETASLFESFGFAHVGIGRDLAGKNRFVSGLKP